ncbi:ATP-binding cassette domain-containing protein [Lactobacillus sp. R2/2]|nr:ATP-binding cassette domain-containing protein [Lactobacillus sp. R2/2]
MLGDSAAGKSTLLNIISGLLKNYTGTIKLGGIDYAKITDTQLHQIISYVEQTPYILRLV